MADSAAFMECLGKVLREVGFPDRDVAEVRSRLTKELRAQPSETATSLEGRPRGAYVPLTVQEIDTIRLWLDRRAMLDKQMTTLCDMAVNCLLYGEEIERLRSLPSATVTTDESPLWTRTYDAMPAVGLDVELILECGSELTHAHLQTDGEWYWHGLNIKGDEAEYWRPM